MPLQALNEVDWLLNLDFGKENDQTLKMLPKERATFLFSAIITTKSQRFRGLVYQILKAEVASKRVAILFLKHR
jgi:superfamily II DNA/RNA helicase